MNNDSLSKKSKSLKSAIERYNTYKEFVDKYNKTRSLDEYVEYLNASKSSVNEDLLSHYDDIISLYKRGNHEPLLSNLYDRLLSADEHKQKIAEELKSLLRES